MLERNTGILSPKGALEAILGQKRNKHRRCVEVAAITRYQSSRRQQRVPEEWLHLLIETTILQRDVRVV